MKMEPAPAAAAYKLLVEKDVDVPMRDGARLKADVFRPDDGGKFPAILNLGPYQKDKLWVPPPTAGGEGQPADELGDRQPGMVGAAGLRRGAGRRPRQRQIAGPVRAVVARRGDRFLRRDRMGGGAALVQRQGRAVRHLLFRHQPVVRRQSPAAVAEGDHSLGGLRRSLPRRAVPWRHPERVHDQLVHRAPDAPRDRPRGAAPCRTAGRPTRCGTGCTTISTAARLRGAQAQWDRITVPMLTVGNWTGFGAASARQHRSVHARRVEAQEASHPQRHARASVLHRGGQARSASLLRLLAQGHRQRRDGRAAGQARDPQGPRRDRMARTSTNGRSSARNGPSSISTLGGGRRPGAARRRAGDGQAGEGELCTYPAFSLGTDGLDLGGLVAGDGRRHQARHGRSRSRRRRSPRTSRSPGRSPRRSMCRARPRTWTCS